MKCLILAAGYATRLYPLTENFPKPLLKVKDKAILDWLIEDIETSGSVDEYVVISNHKFIGHFRDWAEKRPEKITVLDDGTSSNDTRLGAVKDIQFAVDTLDIKDDILVMAGDNLLDFSLNEFVSYAKAKNTSCIMRYYEDSEEKLRRSGVVELDENEKVIALTEKPQHPVSNWCSPAFYYYTAEDVSKIGEAIKSGCNTDAPGSLAAWMCKNTVLHAMEMPGSRYDIGNLESYQSIQKNYKGITK